MHLVWNSLLRPRIEQLAVVGDQSRYSCPASKASLLTVIVARVPSLKASLSSRSHETVGYVLDSQRRSSSGAVPRVASKSPSSQDPIEASKKRTDSEAI
jgi:hypothetical protein